MTHTPAFVATVLVSAGVCCCGPLDGLLDGGTATTAPAAPPAGETRYVVSATTLKVRSGPAAEAVELATVPRGESVIVTGPGQGKERIAGISGAWAPVWWQGTSGYAFDGYLLSVPPPPLPCENLTTWAATIGHAGTESLVSRQSCEDIGIGEEGDCDATYRTPLRNGGWIERNAGWEWGSEVLYVPNASRDAVWAAVRGCVGQDIGAEKEPLPERAGLFRHGELEVTRVVEPARVGWEWSEGCAAYVYVEVVGADVKVIEGGGC